MNNIYLTGMMGCGKTTTGKILAGITGRTFFDTDELIERKAGVSIAEIFERFGEAHFRRMESDALEEISEQNDAVVACGGGIVLDEKNVEVMKETGRIIYLDRDIEELIQTVETGKRPLLKDGQQKVRQIFAARKSIYEQAADYRVLCADTPQKTAEEIRRLLGL